MDYTRLMDTLKRDEGFSPKAFWDRKQWTNGYGTEAKSRDEEITREEASARLANRVTVALHDCHVLFHKYETFDPVRQEALANMAYNLGRVGLGNFHKMLRAINVLDGEPDWDKASLEAFDSDWRKQVGDRALRIVEELRTGEVAGSV